MSTLATTNLKNASSGSNNIVLNTDGTTTITAPSNIIKSGTAVASTSGVAIDFTGLPSWVKRVTVMFSGVSTSGTSNWLVQLGTAGGVDTSGYTGTVTLLGNAAVGAAANFSSGFLINASNAATVAQGLFTFTTLGSNAWAGTGFLGRSDSTNTWQAVGVKTLSGTLTQLRITTVNGTDTFDAGSINILWEG